MKYLQPIGKYKRFKFKRETQRSSSTAIFSVDRVSETIDRKYIKCIKQKTYIFSKCKIEKKTNVNWIAWHFYPSDFNCKGQNWNYNHRIIFCKYTRVDSHGQIWRSCYDMLWSFHGHHEIKHDHGMAVMENGDHGHCYNVDRALIIQPTLLISKQVVVRYFLIWNMLDELMRNYPKDV